MVFGNTSPSGALQKVAEGLRVGGGKPEGFGVRIIRHPDHDRPKPISIDQWCVLGEEGRRRQGDAQNDDPRESVLAHGLYPRGDNTRTGAMRCQNPRLSAAGKRSFRVAPNLSTDRTLNKTGIRRVNLVAMRARTFGSYWSRTESPISNISNVK